MLEVHPSGKAVNLLPQYAKMTIPIIPQLINGFMADEELKRDHSVYMHTRDFLPMPVFKSPLLVFIMKKHWDNRYADSFQVISILRQIIQCYCVNPFLDYNKENEKRLADAHSWMVEETSKLEEGLFKELEGGADFVTTMERTTIERIHILEECIHRMFDLDIPLEYCLTPPQAPPLDSGIEKRQVAQLLCHYFETKQLLRNVHMEKGLPDDAKFEPTVYFDIEDMKTRIFRDSSLHNGYLDRWTIAEYINFLKLEG